MLRNSPTRYGMVAQLLHWTVAGLVIAAFLIGEQSEELRGAARDEVLARHAMLGLLVLLAGLARIAWRWLDRPPPLPGSLPRWEARLATALHVALLAVTLALPVTGLAGVLAGAVPFVITGVGAVSPLVPLPWLHEGGATLHGILGNLLVALFLMHLAAVVWHALSRRLEILGRMIPLGLD